MDKGDYITKRYIVKEKLGEGGYGAVYLVKDLETEGEYALKVAKGESEKEQNRFKQEASILNKLNHKSIVPIYDVFKFEEFLCYTMKYIQGNSLEYYTRKSVKIPPKRISQLMRDIAIGLSYAHENNIIHRDIKPANILYDEQSKKGYITDFGLAKEATGKSLTATGQIVGTPYYLSPEQARGETVTHASDIYSLGATMYHLLTKNPPFEEESRAALIQKIANEKYNPKRIREHNNELHSSLEAICLKAMQKDTEKRYQTMLEFAQDIDLFLENKLPEAPLYKISGANIFTNNVKRVYYPLVITGGIILPIVASTYFYMNNITHQNTNTRNIDTINKLEEKKQLLENIIDSGELNLDSIKSFDTFYQKSYYLQKIGKSKEELSIIANSEKREGIYSELNQNLKALYTIDHGIYNHQLLFELYPENNEIDLDLFFPDVKEDKELLRKRFNIINALRENKEDILAVNYKDFASSGNEDYDTYCDIHLLCAIGKYYKNIADDTFEEFFKKFRRKIVRELKTHSVLYDCHDDSYYLSNINLLRDKSLFALFPGTGKEMNISDKMRTALDQINIKSRDWVEDYKSGLQYTQLHMLAQPHLEEEGTYEAYLMYTEYVYQLSKSAYYKGLIRLEDLLSKYPTSPVLHNDYLKFSSDFSTLQVPVNRDGIFTAAVKTEHYRLRESIDVHHAINFYTNMSFSVRPKADLADLLFEESKVMKMFQENQNKYAVDLGIAIYRTMAQSGYTIPSKELDEIIHDSVRNYGTYDQQAQLLYFQSKYFIGAKKSKLAYTYLKDSKELEKNISNIIDNGMSQVSMDYLTQFYANYIQMAKNSRRIFYVSEVLKKGMPLFDAKNYSSLEDRQELQLIYNEFLMLSKRFKLADIYKELREKKYWLRGVRK